VISDAETSLAQMGSDLNAIELSPMAPPSLEQSGAPQQGACDKPRLLLLDEPFAGMNFDETWQTVKRVRAVRDRGVTVLLVEHDMRTVMRVSDRIMVLNFGKEDRRGSTRRNPARRGGGRNQACVPVENRGVAFREGRCQCQGHPGDPR